MRPANKRLEDWCNRKSNPATKTIAVAVSSKLVEAMGRVVRFQKQFAIRLSVAITFAATGTADAFQEPTNAPLADLDQRRKGPAAAPSDAQNRAAAALKARVARVKVEFDPVVGAPKYIGTTDGFLSGPNGEDKGISKAAAAGLAADDPHRVTKAFLREHSNLFGHGPEVLGTARITREFTTAHSGLKTVVWEQQVDGVPVFEAILISHTTAKGELVNVSSQFVPAPEKAADRGTPRRATVLKSPSITAPQAVKLAAKNLGETADIEPSTSTGAAEGNPQKSQKLRAQFLRGESDVKLVWLPMDKDTLRPCWDVILTVRERAEMYRVLVDAQSGAVMIRRCLTAYISDASYRVFTSDSPSPFSPGHPTPLTNQPPLVSRTLVTWAALDTNASPAGWINDGGNETLGNNVDAHTDIENNNQADLPRPAGSPNRVFDFAMDLTTQDPIAYRNAAVVQLFYLCNWMHDKLYQLGFTEAAGNFQSNNFARGGVGNDAVQADAQDGGGTDNANMSTPPEGYAPRMQMYVFSGPTPRRDGDFDAEIVLHEYTHGLSNRRVGGGAGISALQTGGMGEGWSDWYGMTLLSESGDDVNGNYAAGGYATYQFLSQTFQQNYYYGIRRYPYSTDLSKNPLTFKDIDPSQASSHPGVPISPVIGGGGASEVHNQGEVWCVTLWEARANLITKHGFAVGNQLILQLVTDGMNLSPANPNFLQARDAIIQADLVLTGGANRNELWAAFAKRGMGANATSPSSSTTTGVFESFDLPDALFIAPGAGFTGSGPVGGPFTPNATTFTLTNNGASSLTWTMVNATAWLNVSGAGGTLTPGGPPATVTASLNATASTLPMGIYSGTVRFTNLTSGIGAGRAFILRVGQPDYFTEMFQNGDNDLAFSTITFTPDGSASFYTACRGAATNFPTDPAGGTLGPLSDDTYSTVTLSGTNSVAVYNRRSSVFYIGSNGYLTFNYGDSEYDESTSWHFNQPRVSGLFDDLDPSEGGTISWRELSNRVAVTYQNVAEYGTSDQNSFQIELFFDGRIRLTWLGLAAHDGLAGLSAGSGTPTGFIESDLSTYGLCIPPLIVTVPSSATEGAGILAGQGHVILNAPLATNLTVALASSDATEVTVPVSVVIPAGLTNQAFDLTIVNDSELDGTQIAAITATGGGFGNGSALIAVHDNETAVLHVSLPAVVSESDGSTQGVVSVSTPVAANVTVSLNSSDGSEIQVPSSIVIPAGQTSAVFTAVIVNDALIDGAQPATITAHVQNWTDGTATMSILDNESLQLTVTLPASALENAGTLTNVGTVQLSGSLPTNLVVSLASSNTSLATVPPTVTISAGQVLGVFNVSPVDDTLVNGTRPAIISAAAPGFLTGYGAMLVLDDESPPVPSNPSPADLATNVAANTDLAWSNGRTGITNDVYFGTNPVPGGAQYVGTTTTSAWDLPLLAPNTTYYWQIVARKVGTTPSAVWRFTTRGVDHFEFDPIASPQLVNQPFAVKLSALDEFNRVVSNFTGSATLSAASGFMQQEGMAAFDDLPSTGIPVPSGYRGLSWYNFDYLTGSNYPYSGYFPGTVSQPNVAYNAGGSAANFTSTSAVSFVSAYVTAAWNDNLQFQVQGYAGATLAYSNLYTLSATTPTFIQFNYAGVTAVSFNSFGGTAHPGYSGAGTHFAIDSISFGSAGAISITPTNTGSFANGVWVGNVTVSQLATNMSLTAAIDPIHRGSSGNFDVRAVNDLAVTMSGAPEPVAVGALLTNTITVDNGGPAAATAITLTNFLAPSSAFVSATPSQGNCTVASGRVECALGSLGSGQIATVMVITVPDATGQITNRTSIGRGEADGYAGNNSAEWVTSVLTPSLSIGDASASEANAGFTPAIFAVRLSPASPTTVTVSYATANGSAFAGSDYVSTNGVLTFGPGQTTQWVTVQIIGDTSSEDDEIFFVNLTNASNAGVTRAQGTGVILNVDYIAPAVHIYQSTGSNPALVGTEVDLCASTTGSPYPSFQWQFNGTNLIGATGQCLSLPTIQTNQSGNYAVVASNIIGVITSAVVYVSVIEQPLVYAYFSYPLPPIPAGSYGYLCSQVTLAPPYTLQWRFNDVPMVGEANGCLYLPVVTASQVGAYTLVASNISGSYTSPPAMLTIYYQPPEFNGFYFQQGSPDALLGNDISFCGYFYGSPATYQWRFNGVDLPGETNSCLSLLSISTNQAGDYTLVASNPGGTATSFAQTITVRTQAPVFSYWPYDQITVEGTDVRFQAYAAAGPPAAHVLQFNGTNLGVPFTFEHSAGGFTLLDVTPADMGSYRVVASNIYGMATSTVANLTVTPAGPLDIWIQRNPLPQSQFIYSACHGTNQFVAVGDRGTIMTSPNGANWTVQQRRADLALRGVTYGAGLFVAVGDDGTVFSSPDGTNWAYRYSSPEATLNAAAYGNGRFVSLADASVVPIAVTSVDGVVWEKTPIPPYRAELGITFGNGIFVAVGTDAIVTSTNGLNWATAFISAGIELECVSFLNNQFIAVGANGVMLVSSNGTAWQSRNSTATRRLTGVTYGAGKYVAAGVRGTAFTSADAVTWTAATTGTPDRLECVDFFNGQFVAMGENGTTISSTNGTTWTKQNSGITRDLDGMAVANGTIVMVGKGGSILSSTNGANYTTQNSGVTNDLHGVAWGNGLWVVAGEPGIILTSSNVTQWTSRTTGTTSSLKNVTWSGGKWIAVGTQGAVLTSTDGINWGTAVTSPSYDLNDVAYGNGLYLIAGDGQYNQNGSLFISYGGASWSQANYSFGKNLRGMVFTNGLFFITANDGLTLTTSNGVSFTSSWAPAGNLRAATWVQGMWVVVGNYGSILTSTNLVDWTRRAVRTFENLHEIVSLNGALVAMGNRGTVLQSATMVTGLTYFSWSTVPSPQITNAAITVTLEARDAADKVVTNFNGSVALSANGMSITPAASGNFTNGIWSGVIRVLTPGTNVVVRADNGTAFGTSNPFHVVRANQPPIIMTNPAGQTVHSGNNFVLSVEVYGTPTLTYNWRRSGTNLANGGRISGATSSMLTISNSVDSDSGSYSVFVLNSFGSVTSSIVAVTVNAVDHFDWAAISSPQGTDQSIPVVVRARGSGNELLTNFNGTVSLSASSGGQPVAMTPGVSGSFVSGQWTGSVQVVQVSANVVLHATDVFGHAGDSVPFDVVQYAPPQITLQPFSQTNLPGSNFTFSIMATGAGPLTYQWRFNSNNIANAMSTNLTITNAQLYEHAGFYDAIVTGAGGAVVSHPAVLLTKMSAIISNAPASRTVVQGGTATFTVVAGPVHPLLPYTYRWLVLNPPAGAPGDSGGPTWTYTNAQPAANGLPSNPRITITAPLGGPTVLPTVSTGATLVVLSDTNQDGIPDDAGTYLRLDSPKVLTNGSVVLQFQAASNRNYQLQGGDSPRPTNWMLVSNIAAVGNSNRTVLVTNTLPGVERYYRLVNP